MQSADMGRKEYLYTTKQSYTYDDLYQLSTINGSSTGCNNKSHAARNFYSQNFAYDGNGNLAAEQFGNPAAAAPQNASVSEENGVYSTGYGFALICPDTQNEEKNVYRRNYQWNERNQTSVQSTADHPELNQDMEDINEKDFSGMLVN